LLGWATHPAPIGGWRVDRTFRISVTYYWYKRNIGPDIRKKHVVEYGPSCGLGDEMRAS
jgi:hypothetical protein